MKKTNQDPAFPVKVNSDVYGGITRLEYFAGMAITAVAEHIYIDLREGRKAPKLQEECFYIAEAMLKESERRQPGPEQARDED